MNIKKYASVPTLIEVKLDDAGLLEKYGEAITFYTYDVVGMSTYFQFFDAKSNAEFAQLDKMLKVMILDDKGQRVLADNEDLPMDIAAAAITKLGDILGKSQGKPLTPTPGAQAE